MVPFRQSVHSFYQPRNLGVYRSRNRFFIADYHSWLHFFRDRQSKTDLSLGVSICLASLRGVVVSKYVRRVSRGRMRFDLHTLLTKRIQSVNILMSCIVLVAVECKLEVCDDEFVRGELKCM